MKFLIPSMGIRHVALFFSVALLAGCYQQPSAQKIQYDAEAVEELRQQVKTMDWD